MNEQKIRKLKKDMKKDCITLKKFLLIYYGIYNGSSVENKLSHKDIKFLMPQLQGISFEELQKYKSDMYTGNIVPVVDSYGNVAPYICPELEDIEELSEYSCETKTQNLVENTILSENLSSYELSLLCKEYKASNRMAEYRSAYRILKMKKDSNVKKYHKKKLKLIMKGREEND